MTLENMFSKACERKNASKSSPVFCAPVTSRLLPTAGAALFQELLFEVLPLLLPVGLLGLQPFDKLFEVPMAFIEGLALLLPFVG